MGQITELCCNKSFGGLQKVFSHESAVLKCTMKFSIYLPFGNDSSPKCPILYWLSGLTCTNENFIIKAGAQQHAAKHQIIVVCPDTSPRGVNLPGEDVSYDFGSGAGFYVDATVEPWNKHYKMYSYVTKELPELICSNFPVDPDKQSIMGHSMGGHGALTCYLKNPGMYRSVSAFAPICNPTSGKWGRKAFAGYLGGASEDGTDIPEEWAKHDATLLVAKFDGPPNDILIDQGSADNFLADDQLMPHKFVSACKEANVPVILHMRDGYDHSYYYIASFIGEHFNHHAKYLKM